MKTFLKVLLALALIIVALKLLPIALVLLAALAAALGVAALIGFSTLAGLFCAVLAVVTVLSPIWVPVLIICGIIALIKKSGPKIA